MKRRYLGGGVMLASIVLVVAIVLPCMMPPGIAANESAAAASIRSINVAEEAYSKAYGGYANSSVNLAGATPCIPSAETSCLLDPLLSSGVKYGYRFAAIGTKPVNGANTAYLAVATPLNSRTGRRMFCSTEKGAIRVDSNAGHSSVLPNEQQCAGFSVLE